MARVKNLTIAAMKKDDAKEFADKKKITIHGYEVVIDKHLRASKVQIMVAEVFADLTELGKRGHDLKNFDINGYVLFLMIKHFSSVDIPDKLEDKLAVLNIMLDNDFFHPIVNAFGDEVKTIDTILSNMVDEIQARADEFRVEIEKIAAEQAEQTADEAPEAPENQEA